MLLTATLTNGIAARGIEPAKPDPYVVEIDVRPWIEALRSDDLFEADPAIDGLAALGDPVIPALHAALTAEGEQARIHVVEVLRDIRTPATVDPLITAAADDSVEVRRDAIEALGRLGDPRARPALEAALGDPEATVSRAAAAGCLALCRSPAALRRLVEMSLESRTALSARTSLGRVALADTDASARIRKLADEIAVPVMNDTGSADRFAAALIVAQSGNDTALPALRHCVDQKTNPLLAVFCIQGIGSLGSEESIHTLAAAARRKDRIVGPAACKALGEISKHDPTARAPYDACRTNARTAESGD